MRILDQLRAEARVARGVVQEAADAHQIAAKTLTDTAHAATLAFVAVAIVAVAALLIAAYLAGAR